MKYNLELFMVGGSSCTSELEDAESVGDLWRSILGNEVYIIMAKGTKTHPHIVIQTKNIASISIQEIENE